MSCHSLFRFINKSGEFLLKNRINIRHLNTIKNETSKPITDFMHKQNARVTKKMNSKQVFDYFLVLDFEATCEKFKTIVPQEIIEFPVLKINAKTLEEEAFFHQYVKPKVHPQLSAFCTHLTGIVQDMLEGQPDFETTLQRFDAWMDREGLSNPNVTCTFVTCGDWDLNIMLPGQCKYCEIPINPIFTKWVNIKQIFAQETGTFPRGILTMLRHLDIGHTGRLHSGIDDTRNIAEILKAFISKGVVIRNTNK